MVACNTHGVLSFGRGFAMEGKRYGDHEESGYLQRARPISLSWLWEAHLIHFVSVIDRMTERINSEHAIHKYFDCK